MAMKQVSTTQARKDIGKQIKKAILSGRLAPGQELIQEELAETLGVSRTPVRETLQALDDEGFVSRLPNRHVIVGTFDLRNTGENLSMLCAIELELLRQIWQSGDPARMESLRRAAQLYAGQSDLSSELALHAALSAEEDNHYLRQLHLRVLKGYFLYVAEEKETQSPMIRQALLDFSARAADGDLSGAEQALRRYFDLIVHAPDTGAVPS